MKRFLLGLAVIALSLIVVGEVFAASSEAINPEAQPITIYGKTPTGITKFSTAARTTYRAIAGGELIYTGPCWIKNISLSGAAAGDAVMIYNAISGLEPIGIEFELQIGTNTSNAEWNPQGAYFDQGLYIHSSAATNKVNITYDY